MLFITAGMGGGTGTGAAPEIAKIAREMDVLTVGIVTMPFGFEGKPKYERAEQGIRELKQYCDTVLVILNDKLREVFSNLTMSNAFSQADNVLTTAAKSIAEIITVPGYINVDFEDVKTVMAKSGTAVMGSSTSEGEHRARRAAEEALSSPLLNNVNIHGAQRILLSIRSGVENELSMEELDEITNYIQQRAGDAAEVIFGHGIDETLGQGVSVTVIATGFEEEGAKDEGKENSKKVYDLNSNKVTRKEEEEPAPKYRFTPDTPSDAEPREEEEYFSVGDKDIRFDLEAPYEEWEEEEHEKSYNTTEALQQKKEALQRAAIERVKMLKGIKTPYNDSNKEEEEIREKMESPAYKRRKVQLQAIASSEEHHISRYTLDSETGSIITNQNRFLHDKPC
jgi:cell division protein FtsZ